MKNVEKIERRQTLVLKTEDSRLFEEARFTLRAHAAVSSESEMVKEANRILALCGAGIGQKAEKRPRRPPSALFYFISGIVCGLLVTAAAAAIFAFFR